MVIILSVHGTVVRQLMLAALDLELINGEYQFLSVQPFDNERIFGDDNWQQNDARDEDAKFAYQALLTFMLYQPDNDKFRDFIKAHDLRQERDFNFTRPPGESSAYLQAATHDSIILYSLAINETLTENGNLSDGLALTKKMWGRSFEGVSGTVTIGANGDRDGDYSLWNMVDVEKGILKVVANFYGSSNTYEVIQDVVWPAGRTEPPLDEPICGFDNENPKCQVKGISGLSTNMERNSHQIRAKLANIEGRTVVVKNLPISSVELSKLVLKEMRSMRSVEHANITRFIGACVDPPNICTLTEYCPKGSLQDVLQNDSFKLDTSFKHSLMTDMAKGLHYLHGSVLGIHGRLSSSNCTIDSRFVLKLTDFGLYEFIKWAKHDEGEEATQNTEKLLWKAPEMLRDPNRPPTKDGDIYSAGMILLEISTRIPPFENERMNLGLEEILNKLKQVTDPPLRPFVNLNDGTLELMQLVQHCWAERPDDRPTAKALLAALRKLNSRESNSENILDNLLTRMEQYANNLETLVEDRTAAFLEEKKRAETLLYEVLPKSVADQLKRGNAVDPETFQMVTIFFSDIVGFTSLSAASTPMQVVALLNDLYTCFDGIIGNFDVYKVETIGDAYMVVSGLPIPNGLSHAKEIAKMSLALLKAVDTFTIRHVPDKRLQLRAGVHSGPCVAGVVGLKMPRYCLFGDTVNTASRMESNGEALKIHISSSTKKILDTFETFETVLRGEVEMKGKGTQITYWLINNSTEGKESTA
ncbi:atrial natriuretic peptide receptor 1-like [Amphiura filiformis]|uniref:atrial natriuretic peptide receptor 1-like n=1 Tax=Amphiura filiformis TaxID=82378 RepID=UPI003B20B5C5